MFDLGSIDAEITRLIDCIAEAPPGDRSILHLRRRIAELDRRRSIRLTELSPSAANQTTVACSLKMKKLGAALTHAMPYHPIPENTFPVALSTKQNSTEEQNPPAVSKPLSSPLPLLPLTIQSMCFPKFHICRILRKPYGIPWNPPTELLDNYWSVEMSGRLVVTLQARSLLSVP